MSERLGIPLFRYGLPIFDRLGAAHRVSVGYRGTRDLIFEIGNIFMAQVHEPTPTIVAAPTRGRPCSCGGYGSLAAGKGTDGEKSAEEGAGSMKVAFATQDLKHVDAHFGWAKNIAVYDIAPEGHRFVEVIQFEGDLKEDGNEDKLAPKIEAIRDLRDPLCRGHRRLWRRARRGHRHSSRSKSASPRRSPGFSKSSWQC